MQDRTRQKLSGRELLIIGAGIAAATASIALAATSPQFEVASIKQCEGTPAGRSGGAPQSSPGRLTISCHSPSELIQQAYVLFANGHFNFTSVPVGGGPAWIQSVRYTINAKAEGNPGLEMMMGPMLQRLLEDRFKLKIRRETREVTVYELTVARGGTKIQPVEQGSCTPIDLDKDLVPRISGQPRRDLCGTGGINRKPPNAKMDMHAITLDDFSRKLATILGRPVIDKTGIAGMFDFHLQFSPDETTLGMPGRAGDPDAASDTAAPSIFTAIREQLGLKLDQAKGPGEFLVIDGVERPSEN
jgi:uncharacterized protein (TIGR03435 family)